MKSYLKHLDSQIGNIPTEVLVEIGLCGAEAGAVATGVFSEVNEHVGARPDLLLHLPGDPISIPARLAQMHAFMAWNAYWPSALDVVPDDVRINVASSTAVLVPAYYSFIYLKESLFSFLRDSMPEEAMSARCAQYLLMPQIHTLRNAIAHGNWYAPGDGTLRYWARADARDPDSLEVRSVGEEQFNAWLHLSRGVALGALEAICPT